MEHLTRKPFGKIGIILLWIWKNISIEMELESLNFSFIFQRMSNKSVFSNVLMHKKRTGNLALLILKRENSGTITWMLMMIVLVQQALLMLHGMLFLPMTKRIQG